jgi:signal peptidase II
MLRLGLLVAAPIVVLDQLVKWWVLAELMDPPAVINVTGFFNLVLVWNRGVSFGLFDSDSHWGPILLAGLALLIVVVLLVWLTRAGSRLSAVAIGMVLGGAVGNVIDRVRFGAVVDFLDFHALGYHWPAFNVADSAISIGVGLLLYDGLFENRRKSG